MKTILTLAVLCSSFLVACQQQTDSLGSEKEIIVFADSLDYEYLYDDLNSAFEREVATPWPEPIFELSRNHPNEVAQFTHKPRILIIGALNGNNAGSERIKTILNTQQREKVERNESYVFKTDDPWMRKQRLLVVAANDLETLSQRIQNNRDELFNLFHQPLVERVSEQMFSLYEQKDLEKQLLEGYGWTLRIQHDYQIWKQFPEERFVMLRRVAPERWLFIAWKRADETRLLTEEEVVAWRNEIGQRFYDRDKVGKYDLISEVAEFSNRRALEVRGLWENDQKVAGGPFKCWAFYDETMEMNFLVDISLYAPGLEKKVTYLRQLEIMARTFQTAHDRAAHAGVN